MPILETTPSGKTQFVCLYCGRLTPAPTKGCSQLPVIPEWHEYHGLPCEKIEERERARFAQQTGTCVLRASTLVERLFDQFKIVSKTKKLDLKNKAQVEAAEVIKADRHAVMNLVARVVYHSLDNTYKQTQWRGWDALDKVREELKNR